MFNAFPLFSLSFLICTLPYLVRRPFRYSSVLSFNVTNWIPEKGRGKSGSNGYLNVGMIPHLSSLGITEISPFTGQEYFGNL